MLPSEVQGYLGYLDGLGFKIDEGVYKPEAIDALNILRRRKTNPKERIKIEERIFDVEEVEQAEVGGLDIGAHVCVKVGEDLYVSRITEINTTKYPGYKVYYTETATLPAGVKPATVRAKALESSDLDKDMETLLEEIRESVGEDASSDKYDFDPFSDLGDQSRV